MKLFKLMVQFFPSWTDSRKCRLCLEKSNCDTIWFSVHIQVYIFKCNNVYTCASISLWVCMCIDLAYIYMYMHVEVSVSVWMCAVIGCIYLHGYMCMVVSKGQKS